MASTEAPSDTPAPDLYARMREAVLSLELAPAQRLSERGLEPQFGASRTPIRAALMRLESEGLVSRDPRGWTVAPIDLDELATLAEYRQVLESAIVRLATERATDEDLAAVAELARTLSSVSSADDGLGTGTGFHRELAALSGNAFLASALEGVLTRLYRTRWLEVRSPETRERALHEHEAIAEALRLRDAAGAELAVGQHLRATQQRLLESLSANRVGLRASGMTIAGGQ